MEKYMPRNSIFRTGHTLIQTSHHRVEKIDGEPTALDRFTARKSRSAALLAVFVATAVAGAAVAAERDTAERGTAEDRMACTPDVFRHCSQFIPDAGRITACLRQRVRELSPECRVVMTGWRKG
jgi:hypothetical protein